MDREPGVLGKARAVLSLALVGAGIGLVVAPLAGILSQMYWLQCEVPPFGWGYWRYALFDAIPYAAKDWALLGGFTGGSFGTLLLATREKRCPEELPALRVGAFGGLAGATFLPVQSALVGYPTWVGYPEGFMPLVVTGFLGAGLTTFMVSLAKRAPPVTLPPHELRDQIAAARPMDP